MNKFNRNFYKVCKRKSFLVMGRLKKGYNWHARQGGGEPTAADAEQAAKIAQKLQKKVIQSQDDVAGVGSGYSAASAADSSNALALPGKKKMAFKPAKRLAAENQPKKLSRKRRKHLEKIVDQKRKKADRAGLLEKLAAVQCSGETLAKMTSISAVQTKGLKRQWAEDQYFEEVVSQNNVDGGEGAEKVDKVAWAASTEGPLKKPKLKKLLPKKKVEEEADPNVLGFEEESSSEEEIEDIEENAKTESSEPEEQEVVPKVEKTVEVTREEPEKSEVKVAETKAKKVPRSKKNTKATFVAVNRLPEIAASRAKLPIIAEEQSIMEAISENPVVILAGETGSGKTTQVPQFLYEAGYTKKGKGWD